MVKLVSARKSRKYGPRPSLNLYEYINAIIYVFATILLIGGFATQFSTGQLEAKLGLIILLFAIALIAAVNVHDLIAHMAGIDYCLDLVTFDSQLFLVEFAVPTLHFIGSVLFFIAIVFLVIQMARGYSYKLEKHASNLLIAGPVFWVSGSIHNLCEIYERADGHVQILQKTVQIPFLMGSLLFLVGGINNKYEILQDSKIMGESWVCLCTSGSLLLLIGGMFNIVKVFKMQQVDGVRLEKLRGGAQERLLREREDKVPLILEDNWRTDIEEARAVVQVSTTYKDVLVGGSQA